MILLKELLSDYDRGFKGAARAGSPMITVVDNFRVFEGSATRAAVPLYTIKGNKLFKGLATAGAPLATLVGDLMFPGWHVSGAPMARLKREISIKGAATMGPAVATAPSGNVATLFAATYHALKG